MSYPLQMTDLTADRYSHPFLRIRGATVGRFRQDASSTISGYGWRATLKSVGTNHVAACLHVPDCELRAASRADFDLSGRDALYPDSSARILEPDDRVHDDPHLAASEDSRGFPLVSPPAAGHAAGGARLAAGRRRSGDQPEPLRGQGGCAAAGGRRTSATVSRRCDMPGRAGIPIWRAGPTGRCGGCSPGRLLSRLRRWDRATASRVSHFVAISETVRGRIARCYRRDSRVIQPPVDVEFYTPGR